jgi:hypothetical protein
MGKIRRGNYIFVWFIGDHTPPHVHVYRDGRLLAKWDLLNGLVMEGAVTAKILTLITELRDEGKFNGILKN